MKRQKCGRRYQSQNTELAESTVKISALLFSVSKTYWTLQFQAIDIWSYSQKLSLPQPCAKHRYISNECLDTRTLVKKNMKFFRMPTNDEDAKETTQESEISNGSFHQSINAF